MPALPAVVPASFARVCLRQEWPPAAHQDMPAREAGELNLIALALSRRNMMHGYAARNRGAGTDHGQGKHHRRGQNAEGSSSAGARAAQPYPHPGLRRFGASAALT